MVRLYNTQTRSMEEFRPLKGKTVRMYSCGPTVYDYVHIGNLRSFLLSDLVRRVLELNGYRVKQVMNITDVGHLAADSDMGEEKMERAARASGKSAWDIAQFYTNAFLRDIDRLHIKRPTVMPRATDHIKEQIELIAVLEKKGFTYRTSDGIYFDTSKFPKYAEFSGQNLEEKEAGARVNVNQEKRNPWDFALWKFSPQDRTREMEWVSPWGKGFPGWHIECSAMSRKYLGQPFDIHTGGIDHVPVHHSNEIAQSEAAYEAPLARFWLHGEFLLVNETRMGKSEGNLLTLDEVERHGLHPAAYRYFLLGAHYRSKMNFTWEALTAAQHALWNIQDIVREWPRPFGHEKEVEARFLAAVNDDLDMPKALAILWEVLKTEKPTRRISGTIVWMDKILGLGLRDYIGRPLEVPAMVKQLAREREEARVAKDFSRADTLRTQIADHGFQVEDTPKGPKIRVLRKI
ncbi:MAG: cysteine--tRNA ligase [bacterium]|nr:cysteine--tRNA ligase [bacterium]